jgi:hypothetical protein
MLLLTEFPKDFVARVPAVAINSSLIDHHGGLHARSRRMFAERHLADRPLIGEQVRRALC